MTEETFETVDSTVNTILSNETPEQPSNKPADNTVKSVESTSKPETESETTDVDNVEKVDKVDEELLKVDKTKQAKIGYASRQHKRKKEQEVLTELAQIKEELKSLKQVPSATSQSAYNPINQSSQNPNMIWDDTLQQYVDPNELIAYANNLLGKSGTPTNAPITPPQQMPARPAQSVPQQPQTPPPAAREAFVPQAETQFRKLSERERTTQNLAPNQASTFELGIKEMYDDGLLSQALINGAALASENGLETLYEWSQSDLGRDKLKEIKTYYQNPYEQAAEIGRLVKARDEQRATRSRSNVPQQAQSLTETSGDINDYFNRDMTTIINEKLKR